MTTAKTGKELDREIEEFLSTHARPGRTIPTPRDVRAAIKQATSRAVERLRVLFPNKATEEIVLIVEEFFMSDPRRDTDELVRLVSRVFE